jgi:hypothetical protein
MYGILFVSILARSSGLFLYSLIGIPFGWLFNAVLLTFALSLGSVLILAGILR